MQCHNLGNKAYRVTKKFEPVTITSPLFDMDFLKVDYTVAGLGVTGMALRQVGADMDMNKIETWVDPALPAQGWTDTCGEPAGTVRMIFKPENIQPFTVTAQALVIHCRKHMSCPGYVAHELSGFVAPCRGLIDEADDVATGSQDAKVRGRIEPLGSGVAIDGGGWGVAGSVGASVSALPGSL